MSEAGYRVTRALRLVAVTDSLHGGVEELASRVAAAVVGGATMITLRLPGEPARVLADAARALRMAAPGVPLLVSGRADVALAVNADGVHLGSDDLLPEAVRRFAPDAFIVIASVGAMDELSRSQGADAVAIGPVFAAAQRSTVEERDSLGLARFTEIARACELPALAVGGVSPSNASALIQGGAAGVAVISALVGAADPTLAARELRAVLDASGR